MSSTAKEEKKVVENTLTTVASDDYVKGNPNAPVTFDQRFQMVRNSPFLVLDDLGMEGSSAWAKEKLFQIIDHRYVTRRPTVITTSKNPKDLDERIKSRIIDKRRCFIYAITAPDYPTRINRK